MPGLGRDNVGSHPLPDRRPYPSILIEADILFAGKISHQQNIALVKLLGIQLIHFDGSSDLTGYKAGVFVDNQGTTANTIRAALEGAGVALLIVVDHHEA
jgi:nanoRNase/pAp phosphatase (c-di-AMP/oligoRNAs hydrolase)